jgi:hypothetical protein
MFSESTINNMTVAELSSLLPHVANNDCNTLQCIANRLSQQAKALEEERAHVAARLDAISEGLCQ